MAWRYGLSRDAVDAYALNSHQQALQAQASGWLAAEIVTLGNEVFELEGYQPRGISLPRRCDAVSRDSHPRPTDALALARLEAIHRELQTAGNSCAVVDGAAAALVGRAVAGQPVLAHLLATAVLAWRRS